MASSKEKYEIDESSKKVLKWKLLEELPEKGKERLVQLAKQKETLRTIEEMDEDLCFTIWHEGIFVWGSQSPWRKISWKDHLTKRMKSIDDEIDALSALNTSG